MTDYLALALRQEEWEAVSLSEDISPSEQLAEKERAWKGLLRRREEAGGGTDRRTEASFRTYVPVGEEGGQTEKIAARHRQGTAELWDGEGERSVLERSLEMRPFSPVTAEGEEATKSARRTAEEKDGFAVLSGENGEVERRGGTKLLRSRLEAERRRDGEKRDFGTDSATEELFTWQTGGSGYWPVVNGTGENGLTGERRRTRESVREGNTDEEPFFDVEEAVLPNLLRAEQRGEVTAGLLRQVARAQRTDTMIESGRRQSGGAEREASGSRAAEGLSLQGLDRAVERDARRYGEPFSLL